MLNKITLFKAFTQGSDSCSSSESQLTLLSIRYHLIPSFTAASGLGAGVSELDHLVSPHEYPFQERITAGWGRVAGETRQRVHVLGLGRDSTSSSARTPILLKTNPCCFLVRSLASMVPHGLVQHFLHQHLQAEAALFSQIIWKPRQGTASPQSLGLLVLTFLPALSPA